MNTIVLPPSEIADFGLRWSNWCGANPGKAQVKVTLPNGGGTFTTNAPGTPPCLGEGQGSTFSINPFGFSASSAHANVVLRFYKAINAKDYQSAYSLLGTSLQAQQSYDTFADRVRRHRERRGDDRRDQRREWPRDGAGRGHAGRHADRWRHADLHRLVQCRRGRWRAEDHRREHRGETS